MAAGNKAAGIKMAGRNQNVVKRCKYAAGRSGRCKACCDKSCGEVQLPELEAKDKSWNGKALAGGITGGGHRKRCIYWRQSIKSNIRAIRK